MYLVRANALTQIGFSDCFMPKSHLHVISIYYHAIEIGRKCNLFYDSFSRGCDRENIISTTRIEIHIGPNRNAHGGYVIVQKLVDFKQLIANCKLQNIKWEWKLALLTLKRPLTPSVVL